MDAAILPEHLPLAGEDDPERPGMPDWFANKTRILT